MINIGRAVLTLPSILLYYVKGIYHRLREEPITFLAAGIAFNGILCMIPLLLLFTSIIGLFLSSSDAALQGVNEFITTAFPAQPYAVKIKESIVRIMNDIIHYRTSIGLYSFMVLTWTATSLFSSIRIVLNRIFHIRSGKLLVLTMIEDILWVILAGIFFLCLNVLLWILSYVKSTLIELPEIALLPLSQTVTAVLFLLGTFIVFYIIYRYIPDRRGPHNTAFIASMNATILWWLSGKAFAWYLSTFHSVNEVYGTYAFLIVLLIWIYYSSIVFIIGAIIGQLYVEKHKGVVEHRR